MRFGAFLAWCIVAGGIYVATVLVVNVVVESGNPWLHPPLVACIYLAVTVVQRWVWPRIAAYWKQPHTQLVLPPLPVPSVCADEIHQLNLEEDEGWYPWMERVSGADYVRLMAEAPYVPRHLRIESTQQHAAPPGFIPEQRSDPPK